MNRKNLKWVVFTKMCLILGYISFYLVQLVVYRNRAPQDSFYSTYYIAHHSHIDADIMVKKGTHKEPKIASFRLNKSFHPEYFLAAPVTLNDLLKYSFSIQTSLINETQPLTSFSFNSPSLRGPPVII
jgi:hypothetical protein